jgi:hypothetical protein
MISFADSCVPGSHVAVTAVASNVARYRRVGGGTCTFAQNTAVDVALGDKDISTFYPSVSYERRLCSRSPGPSGRCGWRAA